MSCCVNVTPNVNVMSISYVFRRVELLLPGQPVVSCEETSISREALCFTECRSHSGVYRHCRCIILTCGFGTNQMFWLNARQRGCYITSQELCREMLRNRRIETRFFQTFVSFYLYERCHPVSLPVSLWAARGRVPSQPERQRIWQFPQLSIAAIAIAKIC